MILAVTFYPLYYLSALKMLEIRKLLLFTSLFPPPLFLRRKASEKPDEVSLVCLKKEVDKSNEIMRAR